MMQLVDARLLLSCKSLVQRTIQHVFVERTIITIVYRLVTIIYFHKELAEC
jgi:ABC-type transport system involved in Fe-S cluster assembly fused permease/ATPase subunit